MKNLTLILVISIFLFSTSDAFAESSASVKVQNNINSSSTSNSEIDSHTDITVETDGEVTHYTSDEPNQKIEVRATDGESSIKVDGENVLENSEDGLITPTKTTEKENEITPTPTPVNKMAEFIKEKLGIIERLFSFLGSLGR